MSQTANETAQSPRLALNLSSPTPLLHNRKASPCLYSAGLPSAHVTAAFKRQAFGARSILRMTGSSGDATRCPRCWVHWRPQSSVFPGVRLRKLQRTRRWGQPVPDLDDSHLPLLDAGSKQQLLQLTMCSVLYPCFCVVLGTESRTSDILGRYSTAELQPQPMTTHPPKMCSEGKGKSPPIVG